jgi:hypothetical protein
MFATASTYRRRKCKKTQFLKQKFESQNQK